MDANMDPASSITTTDTIHCRQFETKWGRLGHLLGRGVSGRVHRLETPYAVKIINCEPTCVPATEHEKQAFIAEHVRHQIQVANETFMLRTLCHLPHVIDLLDVVHIHDFETRFVFPAYEGTLRKLITDGALEPSQYPNIFQQIVTGLAAVHEKGIVHRDLKTDNILYRRIHRSRVLRSSSYVPEPSSSSSSPHSISPPPQESPLPPLARSDSSPSSSSVGGGSGCTVLMYPSACSNHSPTATVTVATVATLVKGKQEEWVYEFVISDFGLSKSFESVKDEKDEEEIFKVGTAHSTEVYTLFYRPVELLLGKHQQVVLDTKADIWALGCCLAEILLQSCLFDAGNEITHAMKVDVFVFLLYRKPSTDVCAAVRSIYSKKLEETDKELEHRRHIRQNIIQKQESIEEILMLVNDVELNMETSKVQCACNRARDMARSILKEDLPLKKLSETNRFIQYGLKNISKYHLQMIGAIQTMDMECDTWFHLWRTLFHETPMERPSALNILEYLEDH
jgi:serine/threonine protein kinase